MRIMLLFISVGFYLECLMIPPSKHLTSRQKSYPYNSACSGLQGSKQYILIILKCQKSAKNEATLVSCELVLTPASALAGDAAAGIHKLGFDLFVPVQSVVAAP